jgi:hypothetical protein
MQDFFCTLEAQERTANHQKRRDGPGRGGADRQRGGHQDELIAKRAFGHGPHHRQLALCADARDLLGIESKVITQDPCRLLGGNLGHDRDIVEHGRDVVKVDEQA